MLLKDILSGSGCSFRVWVLIYGPGLTKIKTAKFFETSSPGIPLASTLAQTTEPAPGFESYSTTHYIQYRQLVFFTKIHNDSKFING